MPELQTLLKYKTPGSGSLALVQPAVNEPCGPQDPQPRKRTGLDKGGAVNRHLYEQLLLQRLVSCFRVPDAENGVLACAWDVLALSH